MQLMELEAERASAGKSPVDTWRGVVAPIAGSTAAVSEDRWTLPTAKAIFEAFTAARASGGLARGELFDACSDVCTADDFDAAFERFRQLGMLIPFVSKKREDRYLFNPDSAAGGEPL